MEFSSNQIVFQYQKAKHLSTVLSIKNKQNFNQLFKFKASIANRFIIKPNMGSIGPGQQCHIQIVIHKQIVENFENQKIQILYGQGQDDSKLYKSHMFKIKVEGVTSDLDLTTMLSSKQERIKQLEGQVKNMKVSSFPTEDKKKKSSKFLLKLLVVIVIGLLIGFFGPIKIFKKKIIRKQHPVPH